MAYPSTGFRGRRAETNQIEIDESECAISVVFGLRQASPPSEDTFRFGNSQWCQFCYGAEPAIDSWMWNCLMASLLRTADRQLYVCVNISCERPRPWHQRSNHCRLQVADQQTCSIRPQQVLLCESFGWWRTRKHFVYRRQNVHAQRLSTRSPDKISSKRELKEIRSVTWQSYRISKSRQVRIKIW